MATNEAESNIENVFGAFPDTLPDSGLIAPKSRDPNYITSVQLTK
jgi:hypothetical protein